MSSTGRGPLRLAGVGAEPPGDPASVVTCFTPGTAITTSHGPVAVERLAPGDKVLTRDRGFQPLLWRGETPPGTGTDLAGAVLIRAGALGAYQPDRDLVVSPGHRVLLGDPALLRTFGETEALIEARALVGRPGISVLERPARCYVHLLFEQHEVILSENIWSESFQLDAARALRLLATRQDEILTLFPGLRQGCDAGLQAAARLCLSPGDLRRACA